MFYNIFAQACTEIKRLICGRDLHLYLGFSCFFFLVFPLSHCLLDAVFDTSTGLASSSKSTKKASLRRVDFAME